MPGEGESVKELEAAVGKAFGTELLMNNAGIQPGSQIFDPLDNWERILSVNLWGVIHGAQIFAPRMIERGRSSIIINSGSKQGITAPPGDPAYNVSKAGVKAFTEALQHELRNTRGCRVSAYLYDSGLCLYGAGSPVEKPASAGTRSRPSIPWSSGWKRATCTSSAQTMTCRASSTNAAYCGPPVMLSKTARRCSAGIRITQTSLRRL